MRNNMGKTSGQAKESIRPTQLKQEPLHILIVDDIRSTLFTHQKLTSLVMPAGSTITTASDGLEAYELLTKERFDVVLTDIDMPNMNGIELTKAIRTLETECGYNRVKIIGITANADNHHAPATEAGMDGIQPKPISREEIRTIINDTPHVLASESDNRAIPKAQNHVKLR